jgi:hypothetical protein
MYFLIVSGRFLTKAETCSKQQTGINIVVNGVLYFLFAVHISQQGVNRKHTYRVFEM